MKKNKGISLLTKYTFLLLLAFGVLVLFRYNGVTSSVQDQSLYAPTWALISEINKVDKDQNILTSLPLGFQVTYPSYVQVDEKPEGYKNKRTDGLSFSFSSQNSSFSSITIDVETYTEIKSVKEIAEKSLILLMNSKESTILSKLTTTDISDRAAYFYGYQFNNLGEISTNYVYLIPKDSDHYYVVVATEFAKATTINIVSDQIINSIQLL